MVRLVILYTIVTRISRTHHKTWVIMRNTFMTDKTNYRLLQSIVPRRNEFQFRLYSNTTPLSDIRIYQVHKLSLFLCETQTVWGLFNFLYVPVYSDTLMGLFIYVNGIWIIYKYNDYRAVMVDYNLGGGSWWGHECGRIRRGMFCISVGSNIPVVVYVISCSILLQKSFMNYVGENFAASFFTDSYLLSHIQQSVIFIINNPKSHFALIEF
jgi:hypothetical protein